MNTPRLLNMSGAVMDIVYHIEKLPEPGTDNVASYFDMVPGGGFNVMMGARRSGMEVACGGQLGAGANGRALSRALADNGIEELQPANPDMDSGSCVVLITADAERSFVSWPGTDGHLKPEDLAKIKPRPNDWVFFSGYTLSYPDSQLVLCDWAMAIDKNIPLIFDPAPVLHLIPKPILSAVLSRTHWLSCNLREAETLTGSRNPEKIAAKVLEELCPLAQGVVVRAGEKGCSIATRNEPLTHIPGFKVKAIDTNGAGDIHVGAFVSALARGDAPKAAARYANASAAISVTRHGGSNAPTDREIIKFLEDYPESEPA